VGRKTAITLVIGEVIALQVYGKMDLPVLL